MSSCDPPVVRCCPHLPGRGTLVDHWSTVSSLVLESDIGVSIGLFKYFIYDPYMTRELWKRFVIRFFRCSLVSVKFNNISGSIPLYVKWIWRLKLNKSHGFTNARWYYPRTWWKSSCISNGRLCIICSPMGMHEFSLRIYSILRAHSLHLYFRTACTESGECNSFHAPN